MIDHFLLYTQLNAGSEVGAALLAFFILAVTAVILAVTVEMSCFKRAIEKRLIRASVWLMLSSVAILIALLVVSVTLKIWSHSVDAPAQWFQHIPVQEAHFFQKKMQHIHHPLSINGFSIVYGDYERRVRIEDKVYDSQHNVKLIAQKRALMSNHTGSD